MSTKNTMQSKRNKMQFVVNFALIALVLFSASTKLSGRINTEGTAEILCNFEIVHFWG